MKYALISYSRGKQKEVNADDYRYKSVYSYEKFVCPECGEDVSLVRSDTNFFRHYKKTSTSIDCSLRVEKPSTESIYERVGLPMYLRQKGETTFSLYLGFKALPKKIFDQAVFNKMSLVINNKRYLVDYSRFSAESSTDIYIDYIPEWGKKYKISFEPPEKAGSLKQYWPDYSDGFQFEGALFTVTNQGGKKIRYGDIISTDTEYYWIKEDNYLPSYIKGIEMHRVGMLDFSESSWYVFKGKFCSNISDHEFERLESYLRRSLKVHLLEKQPEFSPLWPPMIKTEEGYRCQKSVKYIHGHVISGNEDAKVYIYGGTEATPMERNPKTIASIPVFCENTFINIDRKYASNGIIIEKNLTSFISHEYKIKIGMNENLFVLEEYEFEYGANTLTIECDKKMHIILFAGTNNYELFDLKRDETKITFTTLNDGDCIYILHHSHLIKKIKVVLPHIENSKQSPLNLSFNNLWNQYKNTKQVFIPEKIRMLLLELQKDCSSIEAVIIENIVRNNKIPLPILRQLEGK